MDGAFAQASKHEGEEAAGQQQAGHAAAHHDRVMTVRRRLRKTLRKARSRNLPMACLHCGGAVFETTCPSHRRTMRGVCSSSRWSWVEKMKVRPRLRLRSRIRSISCVALCVSRLAVGSSASTSAGRCTMARATATRWRSPPESRSGRCPARDAEADAFKSGSGPLAALARAHALHQQRIFDILAGREDGNQVEGLKDESDLFAAQRGELRRLQRRSILSVQHDAAARSACRCSPSDSAASICRCRWGRRWPETLPPKHAGWHRRARSHSCDPGEIFGSPLPL